MEAPRSVVGPGCFSAPGWTGRRATQLLQVTSGLSGGFSTLRRMRDPRFDQDGIWGYRPPRKLGRKLPIATKGAASLPTKTTAIKRMIIMHRRGFDRLQADWSLSQKLGAEVNSGIAVQGREKPDLDEQRTACGNGALESPRLGNQKHLGRWWVDR